MNKINRKIFEWNVRFFTENKKANTALKIIYKLLPMLMVTAYPALLVYTFFAEKDKLVKLVLIPLGVLVLVSVLRVFINAERPYEKYGKDSVFHKKTAGKSMPSRHTASAFIIAMAFLYVNIPMGIFMLIAALLIEISRIASGAHFIRDVVAGAAIGIAAGILFFVLV